MIAANHQRWADWVFSRYLHQLYRRHFRAFHLLGMRPDIDPSLPLLITPNHSSWWDGFFVHTLNQLLFNRRLHLMMLERQLRSYPFFARVGAYSIDPGHPRATLESLTYSLEKLTQPENLVCIFPQGELKPFGTNPFEYRAGIGWILERMAAPIQLLPLGIRIEQLEDQVPDVFFQFGENRLIKPASSDPVETLRNDLLNLRDTLFSRVADGELGTVLFSGKVSISDRFRHVDARSQQRVKR